MLKLNNSNEEKEHNVNNNLNNLKLFINEQTILINKNIENINIINNNLDENNKLYLNKIDNLEKLEILLKKTNLEEDYTVFNKKKKEIIENLIIINNKKENQIKN